MSGTPRQSVPVAYCHVVVNDMSAIRRSPVGFFITFTAEQQRFAAAPPTRLT